MKIHCLRRTAAFFVIPGILTSESLPAGPALRSPWCVHHGALGRRRCEETCYKTGSEAPTNPAIYMDLIYHTNLESNLMHDLLTMNHLPTALLIWNPGPDQNMITLITTNEVRTQRDWQHNRMHSAMIEWGSACFSLTLGPIPLKVSQRAFRHIWLRKPSPNSLKCQSILELGKPTFRV